MVLIPQLFRWAVHETRGGDEQPNNPFEYCMCNYGPLRDGEWCPRCWPDKQPKEKQLSLFEEGL